MLTNNIKFLASHTAPNPKETTYWINTAEDPNGGSIMYHNGSKWTSIGGNIETAGTESVVFTGNIYSLPITSSLIIAEINSTEPFRFSSEPTEYKEIHVIIKNTSDSDIVVVFPSVSPYICMSEEELTIPAKGYCEVNAISDGTNIYLRAI